MTTPTDRTITPVAGRWRLAIWGGLAMLYMLPVSAPLWSRDFDWSMSDFVIAAVALAVLGALIDGALRLRLGRPAALGAAGTSVTAFLLIWIDLAVGVVGNEDAAINLVFLFIPVMLGAGAFATNVAPRPMARLLACAAALQILTGVAGATGPHASEPPGAFGIVIFNAVFACAWIACAALFVRSQRDSQGRV